MLKRVSESNVPSNGLRLKTLLKEAGLKSTRVDASRRLVIFPGRTRDWTFFVNVYNGWLFIHTYVCEIPEVSGLRARLFEAAMTANQSMSLTKFVKSVGLALELEYRDEHVDARVVNEIFGLIVANAEEHYPKLFRIVSGDAVLESLGESTALSGTAPS